MEFKRTAIRLLTISAVPAVLMIGAAVPAVADEGGDSKYSACRHQDRDEYWKHFSQNWASYEEYRDYYAKHCTDDGDRVKRTVKDDVDRADDRDDHKHRSAGKPDDRDRADDKDRAEGGRDVEDVKDGVDRNDTKPDVGPDDHAA